MTRVDIKTDLRPGLPCVRDQADRPTCLAFACSDGHSFRQGFADCLSVECLFHYACGYMSGGDSSDGITLSSVASALKVYGQPREEIWPYSTGPGPSSGPPSKIKKLWHSETEKFPGNAAAVMSLIGAGEAVVIGIRMTDQFFSDLAPSYVIDPGGVEFGAHALLAAGVGANSKHGNCLLVKNSWGSDWGDDGYAWLPSDYLKTKMIGYLTFKKAWEHEVNS